MDVKLFNAAPHSRANWVVHNRLCIGAKPILPEFYNNFKKCGISVFVNLIEGHDYKKYLSSEDTYISFPIKTGRTRPVKEIHDFVLKLLSIDKPIYMHCEGGHGRTGMIASIYVGIMYNMKAAAAINYVIETRKLREDSTRNFVPLPETNCQVKSVIQILGIEDGEIIDRSDKSWLKLKRK